MPESGPQSGGASAQALRQGLRELGWQRLAVASLLLALALFAALRSWQLPILGDAENALYDVRAAGFAPRADTDKRIVLVVYTDETNRKTGQISPVDRTVLAQALAQIEGLKATGEGAKGIGIDILLDSAQDDDPLLQAALRGMTTPVYLAFASNRTNPEAITWEQEQDLRRYIAAVTTETTKPASILLVTDNDGAARRWPQQYPGLPPLLAQALTQTTPDAAPQFSGFAGPIRYRLPSATDRPVFEKIPIDLLADPATAPLVADTIRGRYVLIGGDFADFDQFDTPITRTGLSPDPRGGHSRMIGVEIHASMLAQLLDKALPRSVPGWAQTIGALFAVLLGMATAAVRARPWQLALGVAAQLVAFAAIPFLAANAGFDTLGLPAAGWPAGWLVAYVAVSAALRAINAAQREFAQGALGKYLPRSVASEILRNPERLRLHGEKREIVCLFSDLEGFTKLTHAVEPEMIARLLNDYLDKLSAIVLEHGGTLDKFVGDAVVAFWGAPIAYPDDGARAVKAAIAMYHAGEEFRRDAPAGVPPIGRTRVGVHFGEAIVGNFGGEGRIQYTALGDAMNTAARLEGANKPLETTILVSREAVERSGLDGFRPMGTVSLRGRATPVEVFEPVPEGDPSARALAEDLVAAHAAGNRAAVQALTARIAANGDKDPALANLARRLAELDDGESYGLG
ncbi:adenylate/guanylate cyclase domain-containing protein [Novosphingobium sp.]|uniref:adenylate/guanylate cyclase domain-containing protein n=1 Tax=Novosphingobium sp. TaxID=1874826 RepID=UPI001DB057E9|nr:adenylate/guanylate cyclase domain-containing protein [Novosphingobium sp.]MBX9663077.1 adenylate/guanylate cyclase domain-containing protein [Novosphingobium sp.]